MKCKYREAGFAGAIGLILLAGCATQTPPAVIPVMRPVMVSAPSPVPQSLPGVRIESRRCPAAADIAKLRDMRPVPLRDQKMPATTSERVAKVAAQLGLYEAQGQWADQVERAFRKCDEK